MAVLVEDPGPAPHREVAPAPVTAEQVTDAVLAGSWVVDVRDHATYAGGHVPGSVNVEHSAGFADHVGWLVPRGDGIVLLADSPAVLEQAVTDLVGAGAGQVSHHVLTDTRCLTATHRVSDWAGYRAAAADPAGPRPVLVDVRPLREHELGHLLGAVHVAVEDVERVAPTLPPGELWVHCRSGHRAGIAASLLHRTGRSVVHVDDHWTRAGELGLPARGRRAA